ncbi:MAG: valine--tRNA ligase [Limisphaerales bacterium]
MSEIPKAYEPQAVEEKWYDFWLKQNCFVANPASAKPAYSIVIPPPNVTGMLHMGHVLNNTIQDILARKARMDGKEVLWLPGTDHAGIATQAVVEKTLRKQGVMKNRNELGREKFLEHVWAWKEKHGGIIIQQLKKLGCSCDWTRERFTMDPAYSRCVQKVFVELYKKGLIYRGKRMVNWDPAARTALSDEEVEMIEEKGHLWHLKYPLLDDKGQPKGDEFLVVATTRPETMLGDEAVAVNPGDRRYQKIIGRRCLLPLQNKPIPVIADELVDPKFGTGCVKVTPAHDPADYAIAVRHNLPLTVVIGPDGNMTEVAGEDFDGMDRMEARQAVVEELTEQGLLLKVEDYMHNVGYSQRSHVPIEPYLSEQWFLKYPSVEPSTKAVEEGHMRFHPDRWSKTYSHWMHNLRDWCISRQLWWGHRVPVWVHRTNPGAAVPEFLPAALVPSLQSVGQPGSKEISLSCKHGQTTYLRYEELFREDMGLTIYAATTSPDEAAKLEEFGFTQDPDVLDTWFSSWLWPFATMGWPEQTDTLKKFYPTSDLVTGPDIIFFWVARMIMAGYEFMGDLPFRNVYFTGIIRDKLGRKMSKSLGNSPDPLELIAKYGADALRFGTMRSAPLGLDVLFDGKDVELGRNFCNKLWNACRFRQMQGGNVQAEIEPRLLTSDDKWILLKLDQAIREITTAFEAYRFNEATQTLYRFFWSEYCDWYIEASKEVLSSGGSRGNEAASLSPQLAAPDAEREKRRANTLAVIDFVLSHTLRLFHPFLPFITEELWHGMGYHKDMLENQGGQTIMFAPWPKPLGQDFPDYNILNDRKAIRLVEERIANAVAARDLKRQSNLATRRDVPVVLKPSQSWENLLPTDPIERKEIIAREGTLLAHLSGSNAGQIDKDFNPTGAFASAVTGSGTVAIFLGGVRDIAAEKARLTKELEKVDSEITKAEQKLNNPNFTSKAPPHVLQQQEQRLAEWQARRERVKRALESLQS